ncbi:MAG TPA: ATP-binding cassette domain-containing protein [Conexibacter sp.]|jgi:ribose/xylose/arabinose/galactoside ABC-type transport system permease subunit/ABC-type branched-subunit amino acid transport system ATPase component|nr:ATP-binding cassette domain-containing protein [Conexibacter sp.]
MGPVRRPQRRVGGDTSRIGLAVVAVGLALLFHVLSGNFLSFDNADSIMLNSSALLIAGIATGALVISGNLDLSIGGIVALVSVVAAYVARDTGSVAAALIVGMALGAALGACNGLLVRMLTISPLIVTLGTMTIFHGLAYVVANGGSVYNFPQSFIDLGRFYLLGVPGQVWIALAFFVIGAFVLMRTVFGVRTFAIGGNPDAARLAGIKVGRHVVVLYALSGLAVGLVGVLTTAQIGAGTPTTGTQFEFDVLTAVILGGVGFAGGTGRPLGIFIGVITIGILDAGLVFAGVADFWQDVAKGSVLLLALASDQLAALQRTRKVGRAAAVNPPPVVDAVARTVGTQTLGRAPGAQVTGAEVFACSHVAKRYGAVWAVRDVSLVAHAGEVLCLVGDNGAGKSSIIKCISGVVPPDGGTMRMDGESYAPANPAQARRAGVATVYQDLALCPNLGAALNLALGVEPRKGRLGALSLMDFARAGKVATQRLESFGIELEDQFRPVGSLSGGQRQSVAIARVVEDDVRVVILDEPTAALGVKQSARVLELCRRLAGEGIAVILITHDVEAVMQVADRIVALCLGANLYSGAIDMVDQSSLIHLMAGFAPEHLAKREPVAC